MARGHPLNESTLLGLARRVRVPAYDRAALTPAVVHLSVGHFHRSHQAVYFDDLARRGATGWGLTGVGLRRRDIEEALAPQDWMYTVVERWPDGDRPRVVGVMGRYLFAPDDARAVIDALADQRTRLVTLTVTGAGYHVDTTTGAFQSDHEEVRRDLDHPGDPRSALGFLVEALDVRRRRGRAPFTILSCDNLLANGEVTRTAVVSFARLRDERLACWIENNVAFPSSMVDRITPKTTQEDRERLTREFGITDRSPAMTEPFSQWVIEDAFCNGRPPLHHVGARFVADVRPYSLLKTRLLNAAHCALGPLGSLAGYVRTDDVMADPAFRAYVERLMRIEIAPLLPRVAGVDLDAYQRSVLERLANPSMGDQLARLCRGASLKLARHVLPTLRAARDEDRPYALLTLAVAAWCKHLRGYDDAGLPLAVDDPAADRLREVTGPDPRPLLRDTPLFGPLARDEGFVTSVEQAVWALHRDGARGALAAAIELDCLVA